MSDASTLRSPSAQDRQIVHALARGLSLLASFRVNRPLMTNGELSAAVGLPRSSVSRLCHTLVKLGYLEYDSRRRAYRLGAKVLSISYAMLGGMALRALTLPHMKALAERSNSLVSLATCENYSMLIIDVVMASKTLALPLEIGSHVSLDTSAMGRAYLASCSAAEQKAIMQHLASDQKRNPDELRTMKARIQASFREQGYCTSIHEWRNGVTGVAVPLYLKHFGRRLVLSCGGSIRQLTPERIANHIAPALIHTASEIEKASEALRH